MRILMVEGSQADVELMTAGLEHAGREVAVSRVDSREAFAAALTEFDPDVVLCDHALESFNARGALEVLRILRPGTPLIVVSGTLDESVVVSCLRAGAEDVVHKSNLGRLPGSITAALAVRSRLKSLSPRQLQVLRLVAEGHTNPAIAAQLTLSIKTVETHRSELMKRLAIRELASLVRYAVRVGLVPLET